MTTIDEVQKYLECTFKLFVNKTDPFQGKKNKAMEMFKDCGFSNLQIDGKYRRDVILSFENEEKMNDAKLKIENMVNKHGDHLYVCRYVPKSVSHPRNGNSGQARPPKSVFEVTCPLYGIDYETQLMTKHNEMIGVLKSMHRTFKQLENDGHIEEMPDWWLEATIAEEEEPPEKRTKLNSDELATGRLRNTFCSIDRIVPSPITSKYRNKGEFAVGLDPEGNIAVGFCIGRTRHNAIVGKVTSEHPLIPQPMIDTVSVFETFITNSPLPIINNDTRTGVWRQLTVRYFESTNELMAIVLVKDDACDSGEFATQMQLLKEEMIKDPRLVSFHLQRYNGVSAPETDSPTELLHGQPKIHDIIGGVKFAVSPNAFFQVNSQGAKILFDKAISWAFAGHEDTSKMTLLDVCCGTGTIGLGVADRVAHVVGIDCCRASIEDARVNAKVNNITNSVFVADFAENVILNLMSMSGSNNQNEDDDDEKGDDTVNTSTTASQDDIDKAKLFLQNPHGIIAIVDPPRSGLHRRVLRTLRVSREIKYVVYVSCNPAGSLKNDAIALCRGTHKKRPGYPFKPVKFVPVDMFPNTAHCESITLFEKVFDSN